MSTQEVNRIENLAGEGVNVAGLAKIEDTGKNICSAWVVFDGTQTPPTIQASYNVTSVTRTATGKFEINFTTTMDNANYTVSGSAQKWNAIDDGNVDLQGHGTTTLTDTVSKCYIRTKYHDSLTMINCPKVSVVAFGGKA